MTLFVLSALMLCGTKMQAQEPYAVLSNDNTTLTFYYDNYKADRNGLDIGPFDDATKYRDLWDSHAGDITTVVFDDSFADCTTLTSTASWFKNFHKLTSIVGISNLKTDNVTSMLWMFSGCINLVGGLGTTYDENHIDGTYARVDGGAEEPGYLTYKKSLGIQGIRNNDSADAPAYTLSGQRITTPHKGISIVGGRKVVVR